MIDKKKGLMILAALPMFVSASTTYKNGVDYANRHINDENAFKKYLLIRDNETEFIRGGFLSKEEFDISSLNGNSYLAPGIQFWTLTDSSTGKKYVIDYSIRELDKTLKSGVRVTEYVRPETEANGTGSYSNPWVFVEKYKVTAISSSSYGTIEPEDQVQTITKGKAAVIRYLAKNGYEFESVSCSSSTPTVGKNTITVPNINEDTSCVINFKPRDDIQYDINYYLENANNNDYTKVVPSQTLLGTTNATISVSEAEINAAYPSYNFNTTKSTTSGKVNPDQKLVLNIYLDRKRYSLTLTKGTGISAVTGEGTYKEGQNVSVGATVSSGYTWSKWTGSVITTISNNYPFTMPGANIAMTATATKDPAPTPTPTPTPSTPSTPSGGGDTYATVTYIDPKTKKPVTERFSSTSEANKKAEEYGGGTVTAVIGGNGFQFSTVDKNGTVSITNGYGQVSRTCQAGSNPGNGC